MPGTRRGVSNIGHDGTSLLIGIVDELERGELKLPSGKLT